MHNRKFNPLSIFFSLILIVSLNACTSPSADFHNTAAAKHFNVSYLTTPLFHHTLYTNNAALKSSSKTLHIYLDGDGSPWLKNRWIAIDPTSRKKMILDLMSMDKAPSLLLGRPCYYGLHATLGCHPRYWTSHRYAEEIVQSMKDALIAWLAQHPNFINVTFIGYSGGGTLAVLLVPHFTQTRQVITIAANLDINAWAKRHGYSPLLGSLNPISQPKLNSSIKQLHFAGGKDTNVPASIITSYVDKQQSAKVLILKNQAHCCWDMQWLSILAIINGK